MRRLFQLICSLLVLSMAACTKPEVDVPGETTPEDKMETIKAEAPLLAGSSDTVADIQVAWKTDDALALFDKQTHYYKYDLESGDGTVDAVFTLHRLYDRPSTGDLPAAVAIFPFSLQYKVKLVSDDYEVSPFTLQSEQNPDMELPMTAVSGTGQFKFHTPCAVLEFDVPDFAGCQAHLRTLGEEDIAGTGTLCIRDEGHSSVRLEKGLHSISATAGKLVDGHAKLRFAVLPASFSKGVFVEITDKNQEVHSKIISLNEVEAGKVYPCGKISMDDFVIPGVETEEGSQQNNEIWFRTRNVKTLSDIDGFVLKKSAEKNWWKYESLKETELTVIPDSTFYLFKDMTEVRLPQGVSVIGDAVFGYCSSLTAISFPSALKRIGTSAFEASAVQEIVLPEGLEEIGERAFAKCTLKSMVVPSTLKKVYNQSFGASVESFTYMPEFICSDLSLALDQLDTDKTDLFLPYLWKFVKDESLLNLSANSWSGHVWKSITFMGEDKYMEQGPQQSNEIWFKLKPGSVPDQREGFVIRKDRDSGCWKYRSTTQGALKVIPDLLFFGNAELLDVTLPDQVETIGNQAFCNCPDLVSIKLPESIRTLGTRAFADCPSLVLSQLPAGIERFNDAIFYGTPGFSHLVLGQGLKYLSPTAFDGAEITDVTVLATPDTRLEDGSTLDEVLKLNGANTINLFIDRTWSKAQPEDRQPDPAAYDTWANYSWSKIIYIDGNITSEAGEQQQDEFWFTVQEGMKPSNLRGYVLKQISGKEGWWKYEKADGKVITEVRNALFYNKLEFKSIILPSAVENILVDAFSFCQNLVDITLPESLRTIERRAFAHTSLKQLQIPEGTTSILDGAFCDSKALETVTIPSTLKVYFPSFSGCTALKTLKFEASPTLLKAPTFDELATEQVDLYLNPDWKYETDGTSPNVTTALWVGKQWKSIRFSGHSFIEETGPQQNNEVWLKLLPGNRLHESSSSFLVKRNEDTDWWKYESSTGKDIIEIKSLFAPNIQGLIEVHLPESVQTIGSMAFESNPGLKTINFPAGLKHINEQAFESTGLQSALLPEGLLSLDCSAFSNCTSLKILSLPSTLQSLTGPLFLRHLETLTIKVKPAVLKAAENAGFGLLDMANNVDLVLSPDWARETDPYWKPDLENNEWKHIVWKSIRIAEN